MTDLKAEILSLLSALPVHAAAANPAEELPLPSLTVSLEGASVFARAGGAPYLEEGVYSVTLMAADRAALETLAASADAVLTGAGFRLEGCRDEYNETARAHQKSLSYRAVFHGNTLYPS